ncbi:MAG: hypothetical protein H7322_07050 [Ramlibacter sp.]|nr:hypothetical protein [Ramlibacter sp.]
MEWAAPACRLLLKRAPRASTPQDYKAYILAEMKKWEPVVKATGANLD